MFEFRKIRHVIRGSREAICTVESGLRGKSTYKQEITYASGKCDGSDMDRVNTDRELS
jgi:hypothetical protein